ncbi:hypothetical protein [uncultured Reyranella sp.]|jgi:hypothetical protein|uniref:hypothetical protein n=1 Tax=uncultured Reyranella sp. TaxID=735512 RepID=UPI00259D04A2|nr:hypothetical protein [uncultured Reyranella sp.]
MAHVVVHHPCRRKLSESGQRQTKPAAMQAHEVAAFSEIIAQMRANYRVSGAKGRLLSSKTCMLGNCAPQVGFGKHNRHSNCGALK